MTVFQIILTVSFIIMFVAYGITEHFSLLVMGVILCFCFTLLVLIERYIDHSISLLFVLRLLSLWLAFALMIALKNPSTYVAAFILLSLVLAVIEDIKKEMKKDGSKEDSQKTI